LANWFTPLSTKPQPRQFLGFDIEGTGELGGFICGSISGETVSSFYLDRENMYQDLLHYAREGFWIFSHNLQYDLPILEGDHFPSGELIFTKYNLLWATYTIGDHKVRIYDSLNLFPRHSVKMIGDMVGLEKLDLDDRLMRALVNGRGWEQFIETDRETIRRYCLRDAEIVYRGVAMLQEIVLMLGGQLRPTISGTALDVYRRAYHKWPWQALGQATNDAARAAYYGGRVENYIIGQIDDVNMYDVTSLYPHAQRVARFPHPGHLQLDLEPKINGDFWKGEGIVAADVTVPDVFVPPLPHRHAKRLFFPIGTLHGSWTVIELQRALELGCKLERVHWTLTSQTTFNPFEQFTDDLFGLRLHYLQRGAGQANLVKLLLNSLYGRWGLNPANGLYRLVDVEHQEDLGRLEGYQTYDLCGHLVAFGPIETRRYPDYVNVLFAAQVASQARLVLLEELEHQGEQLVYCDTDSIITRGEIETGEGLGTWRQVMSGGSADIIGLKEYSLHNAIIGDRYVAKGVPVELQKEYLKTGAARFYRALGIREALRDRQRPSTWIETFKGAQTTFPKRYPLAPWQLPDLPYRPTRPYQAIELGLVTMGAYLPPEQEPEYHARVYHPEPPRIQGALFPKGK